jgi:hypothetical protein
MHFDFVRVLPGALEPAQRCSIELPQPHSVLSTPRPPLRAYDVRQGLWHPVDMATGVTGITE